ncbi:dihydrolipoamide acetyltransferase family protein [Streptomyces sp. MZ04]|uniref:dihydrolipoamide acetyltransferase family protein n=1 Tax=Streptomyces sp. MZ04 TaxID=2559236 RepID=UPI00107EB458|nr:dihydrolipoamide acetyltransferase family protein [Streptomyces sp. MZ04]TGB14813.1 2-oxo acid dehydrogenase subunit E2 [Streptomyces sp. MZ04]
MTDDTVRDFPVPDLGEGLADATVVAWLVEPGDSVTVNQPLCSLETAKAEVEIPSPFAGAVLERRGEPGETLAVGTLLVRIDTAPAGSGAGAKEPAPAPTPVLVGYGTRDGRDSTGSTRRTVTRRPAPRRAGAATATETDDRPRAKPPVRQLARRLGVNLDVLGQGSGPDGVITRADVQAAAAAPTGGDAAPTDAPLRGARARAAERMATSRQEIPDAHCSVVADFSRLLALRDRLRADAGAGVRAAAGAEEATPFALLLRLLTLALQEHPRLNSTFVKEPPAVRTHPAIHLGIGTATPRGLMVPVIRHAERLSTAQLAAELSRLVTTARSGSLTPGELTGSTFTVSNFGALGVDEGVPVINPPEAAILGVGAVKNRPHVTDDDRLVVRPTATLTCAFDHRVCDGAEAAAFLTCLRDLVESPEAPLLWR